MVELKNITKTYLEGKKITVEALKGISTVFPDTGMVFIVGKSGGGKSTLLNILGGLDTYDGGDFLIDGVSTKDFTETNWDSYRNHYVGFVFQDHHLMPEYNVRENIGFALALQSKKADQEKIEQALKIVDMENYGERRIRKLSGGQRQRVAIARALVKEYHMILADEPTGNLDAETAKEIFGLLKAISKTKLVVVVTHDMSAANAYADMSLRIRDGQIVESAFIPGFEKQLELPSVESHHAKALTSIEKSSGELCPAISLFAGSVKKSGFQMFKQKLTQKATWLIIGRTMKNRVIRLILTILLSVIMFSLLASAFKTWVWTPYDSQKRLIEFEGHSIIAHYRQEINETGSDYFKQQVFQTEDISELTTAFPSVAFYPIHDFSESRGESITTRNFARNLSETEKMYYMNSISAICLINAEGLRALDFQLLAGEYPNEMWGDYDIAISKYTFEIYQLRGYAESYSNEPILINTYEDMIGKVIDTDRENKNSYVVRGIVDTRMDSSYDHIKEYVLGKTNKVPSFFTSQLFSEYMKAINCHDAVYGKENNNLFKTTNYLIRPSFPKDNKKLARFIYDNEKFGFKGLYSRAIAITAATKNQFNVTLAASALILAVFSIFMLASFTYACVHETRNEIGILRCSGASKKDIFLIYLIQALLVAIVILGLSLTLFISVCLPLLASFNAEFLFLPFQVFALNILDILFLTGSITIVAILFSFLPQYFIVRKLPARILTNA